MYIIMSHPAIDFYLRELDLSSNATLATIAGGEITLYPSFDDKIEFDMSLSLAQNFFHFVSDGHDISDDEADDILFRHHNAFENNVPLGINFMDRMKCISTMCHTDERFKSLPDNYLRDGLAQPLFNTWKAVEILSNEYAVRENLRLSILNRIEDILDGLHTRDSSANTQLPSMAVTVDNPARTLIRHILKADSSRLTPLHRVPTVDTSSKVTDLSSVEFYMPLTSGDSLAFLVEVIADPDQAGIIDTPSTGAITIPNRKFLVVANLVGDNYWDLATYKDAIVAEFQVARTLAANAKTAKEAAATTLTAANALVVTKQAAFDADPSPANQVLLTDANAAKVIASNDYNTARAEYERLKTLANGLWNECQPARGTDDVSRTSYQ